MSRHGFTEDVWDDEGADLAIGRWNAQVKSALRGKRGQRFLRDLVAALDALPEKRLISGALKTTGGEVCALGAVAQFRKADVHAIGTNDDGTPIDESDWEDSDWSALGHVLDIAQQLAREVMYANDEVYSVNPEERWRRMRAWAVKRINVTDEGLIQ